MKKATKLKWKQLQRLLLKNVYIALKLIKFEHALP